MNVVDRTGDYSGGRWRGKVVNVMDPKKQGRLQVRVVGLHDDEALIPDRDLPWAQVRMPINSGAGIRGVSGSPVGVVPGTIVDGYFGDSDRTVFIASGILLSAGKTKTGQVVDGSYVLDESYNGVANAARGQDLNAAFGGKNLPAVSQIGAVFPAVSAGLGSMASHTGDILSLLATSDPYNMSGAMASSVTGFGKGQMLYQLSSIASAIPGGMLGIASTLRMVESGIISAASLPTQLQNLVSNYPNSIGMLITLATNLGSTNPSSLLNAATGGLLNQALGVASLVGSGFSSAVSALTSSLALTSKQREFALEAAQPTPPPIPEAPTTTSSKAATKPAASASTDPWAITETYDYLPVAINANQIDENLTPVTSEEILGKTVDTPVVDAEVENASIVKQIGSNGETQAAASAEVRAMNEGTLSPKERAAQIRAVKNAGGIY